MGQILPSVQIHQQAVAEGAHPVWQVGLAVVVEGGEQLPQVEQAIPLPHLQLKEQTVGQILVLVCFTVQVLVAAQLQRVATVLHQTVELVVRVLHQQ
jgi:hypothetical protein